MRRSAFLTVGAGTLGVVLLFVVVCVAPSPVSAQTIHRISKLTVVDANGLDVGTFIVGNNQTAPATNLGFQVDGRLFTVITTPQGFRGLDLFFEDLGCKGAAFVRPLLPFQSFAPLASLHTPGATVFLADPAAVGQTITPKSHAGNFQCFDGEGFPSGPKELVPAVPVIDLYTVFTPPFSVRGTPATPVAAQIFNDVAPVHPFFSFIQALAAEGITGGCSVSPPLFCPDDPVTRGQAAVFFGRALGLVP